MRKTKKEYEQYLNKLYKATTGDYHEAQERFGYLAKTKLPKHRLFGGVIHPAVIKHYNAGKLGTMQRKFDPIGFNVGFNEWCPQ